MSQKTIIAIDYATIVTMRTINGKSVQDVATHFGITWKEAADAIRAYGLVVAKDEKAPTVADEKAYEISLTDTNKIVEKKEKTKKAVLA